MEGRRGWGGLQLPDGIQAPQRTDRADDARQYANGVRSLDVCWWVCHHRTILSADPWSDDVPVPSFGPRMVCTTCGIIGADARPHWQEQPPRETLTGVQWC